MDRRAYRATAGYSLIELVFVMGLMAIIAAIAVPAYRVYIEKAALRTAAREITSDMLTMRSRAMSENTPCRMVFNTADASYTLEKGDAEGTVYTVQQTRYLSNIRNGIALAGADFDSGAETAVFQSRGTCSYGSVILNNANGNTATIAITLTGRTYVRYQ